MEIPDRDITEKEYRKLFEEMVPMHKFLDLKLLEIQKDFVKIQAPFKKEMIGNFLHQYWHGGMIAAVVDAAGGLAAGGLAAASFNFPKMGLHKVSTIDLRIDYLKPVKAKDIIAVGEIVRSGNKSILVKVKVFDEDFTEVLVEGKGLWNVSSKQ